MDQADPTPADDADTAPISVTAVSAGGGGSTAFTGFPSTWPFVALFAFMLMGLASIAESRRRRTDGFDSQGFALFAWPRAGDPRRTGQIPPVAGWIWRSKG